MITDFSKIDDITLWKEFQQGNLHVLKKLFNDYYIMLCYLAQEYVHNKFVAEEIVGDVYNKIWEKRESLTISSSIRWYFIKSVQNRCLNLLKTNDILREAKEIESAYNYFSSDESPLDYMISKELEERISDAILSLPPQYQRAFTLSFRQCMSYNEISVDMNISINTVKLYLKKALKRLRNELKDYI